MRAIAIIFVALAWASQAEAAALAVKADATPTAEQGAIIAKALPKAYQGASFTVGTADLNGDGKPDLIVQFSGSDWCSPSGQGCQGTAILSTAEGYADHDTPLAMFGETVNVLPSTHHGLHDLSFDGSKHVFKFDGKAYK